MFFLASGVYLLLRDFMFLLDQAGAGKHLSTIYFPDRGLQPFVEHFWIQQTPFPNKLKQPWRIVPDPNPHIIFSVSQNERSGRRIQCNLVGARSTFADVPVNTRLLTLGVRFLPGLLHLLCKLPATDFTDRAVPIPEVFGNRGTLLVEQLAECMASADLIRSISDFLSRELAGVTYPGMFNPKGDRADDFAAYLGLPSRTLHARVTQQVGLSPKRLLRIRRLHRALNAGVSSYLCWTRIAADGGFADQAHMIREFQCLLGEAPVAWKKRSHAADLFNPKIESPR